MATVRYNTLINKVNHKKQQALHEGKPIHLEYDKPSDLLFAVNRDIADGKYAYKIRENRGQYFVDNVTVTLHSLSISNLSLSAIGYTKMKIKTLYQKYFGNLEYLDEVRQCLKQQKVSSISINTINHIKRSPCISSIIIDPIEDNDIRVCVQYRTVDPSRKLLADFFLIKLILDYVGVEPSRVTLQIHQMAIMPMYYVAMLPYWYPEFELPKTLEHDCLYTATLYNRYIDWVLTNRRTNWKTYNRIADKIAQYKANPKKLHVVLCGKNMPKLEELFC